MFEESFQDLTDKFQKKVNFYVADWKTMLEMEQFTTQTIVSKEKDREKIYRLLALLCAILMLPHEASKIIFREWHVFVFTILPESEDLYESLVKFKKSLRQDVIVKNLDQLIRRILKKY